MSSKRAILVGAGEDRHLDELGRLVDTLGLVTVGRLEQSRRDGSGYLGKGKREELSRLVSDLEADFVVTDDELTASQARNLEKGAGPVVDRTELIIRIFESHAHDAASRLEVELADLEYRLPRVKGHNTYLSRLGGGGVTTRGPGEQKLEYDRRAIRRRMETIRRKLEQEKRSRETRTSRLKKQGPPTVALVGYTNAGKTTILNALSGAERSTKDRLFETLETATRVVDGNASSRPDFVVTDTVGFISKLPTQLVHSFASTLESTADADILVLCADAHSENLEEEIKAVRETLETLTENGVDKDLDKRKILCLNKMDLLSRDRKLELRQRYGGAVMVSALEDVESLREEIYRRISGERETMDLLIPHSEYGVAASLYGQADIHDRKMTEKGVLLNVSVPSELLGKYACYRVA